VRIILGGGGSADDERPLHETFAGWIGPRGSVLYWPVALRDIRTFESCLSWMTGSFEPLGITDIHMWTSLSGHRESELDRFDGVYIGGGNTYSLLAELRESGFDRHLSSHARRGKAVYGGSAGAAVLGRDIRTVAHMDQNQVGLTDTSGLDLAGGYAIWVHHTPADDGLVHSFVERYRMPVLALSERAGFVIEDSQIRGGGFETVWRFDDRGKESLDLRQA
jgi:dipeptidase E